MDGGVLADRFLERRRTELSGLGFFPEEGGHGRDFGGLNVSRYIAPIGQPIGVVDLVNGTTFPNVVPRKRE